jgi:hypothetical protein
MTNTSVGKVVVALATVLVLVLVLGSNASATPPDSDEKVRIVVYLIKASDDAPGVDSEIKDLVRQFGGAFRYSSYRLVSKIPKSIPLGSEVKIPLPGSRRLHIYARGREGKRIRLKIKIREKSARGRDREMLNTEFRIVEGGTIMIGGYNYHEGKLMVAISADM